MKFGLYTPERKFLTSSYFVRGLLPLNAASFFGDFEYAKIDPGMEGVETLDALFLNRAPFYTLEQAKEFTFHLRKNSAARLVVDVDDSFEDIPKSHPNFSDSQRMQEISSFLMKTADKVIFSTDALQSKHSCVNSEVVPASVDTRLLRGQSTESLDTRIPLKVLYFGSATHCEDFAVVRDSLAKLEDEGVIELYVAGVCSKESLTRKFRKIHMKNHDYPHFANWLSNFNFDLGIAPLLQSDFNEYKSDLKILELLSIGVPLLATSHGPYLAHRDTPGVKTIQKTDDWEKELRQSAQDFSEFRMGALESRIKIRRGWRNSLSSGKTLAEIASSI